MDTYKVICMVDNNIIGVSTGLTLSEVSSVAEPVEAPEGHEAWDMHEAFITELECNGHAVLVDHYKVFEWDKEETESVLVAFKF